MAKFSSESCSDADVNNSRVRHVRVEMSWSQQQICHGLTDSCRVSKSRFLFPPSFRLLCGVQLLNVSSWRPFLLHQSIQFSLFSSSFSIFTIRFQWLYLFISMYFNAYLWGNAWKIAVECWGRDDWIMACFGGRPTESFNLLFYNICVEMMYEVQLSSWNLCNCQCQKTGVDTFVTWRNANLWQWILMTWASASTSISSYVDIGDG